MARSIAGIFAPRVPKLARAKTWKGVPYFAPACAFKTIGTNTIRLPSKIVKTACFQFMPPTISELASMKVVTFMDIEDYDAMELYVVRVRPAGWVGARSSLQSPASGARMLLGVCCGSAITCLFRSAFIVYIRTSTKLSG